MLFASQNAVAFDFRYLVSRTSFFTCGRHLRKFLWNLFARLNEICQSAFLFKLLSNFMFVYGLIEKGN